MAKNQMDLASKLVIYQVFTRLFGNKQTYNKPWGTREENGVGKFEDFSDTALSELKRLGITHIWYTGVPQHALIADYSHYGISSDHPDIVKGRAGSPYAVKDYYSVNPDLANDPSKRLEEFESLIARTHEHGIKVIIDIVPNHVARAYDGASSPAGVRAFGADDDTSMVYKKDNNFYYIPGQAFQVPTAPHYQPLGGDKASFSNTSFKEEPAKWTGNNSRGAKPDINDWYETVKINYGVAPDGHCDFPPLPSGYGEKSCQEHNAFWKDKSLPSSWNKFREVALFWLDKGVDGFRYDMAEMVPVEFWSFVNSAIKARAPDTILVAEVYNPTEYRRYLQLGKMDYLYDKVEFYDKLKDVVRGHASPDDLVAIQASQEDIKQHMLRFVENHDEQRVASEDFAGNGHAGKPLILLSATMTSAPVMLYFGQEVGEAATEDGGFGKPSRTSIFDYVGVPAHQRWMNGGRFDGGRLDENERDLRDFYQRLLNFVLSSRALLGHYAELQTLNRRETVGYGKDVFSFVRWDETEKLIIVTNLSTSTETAFDLKVPAHVISRWRMVDGRYEVSEQLSCTSRATVNVKGGQGTISVKLLSSDSVIYKVEV